MFRHVLAILALISAIALWSGTASAGKLSGRQIRSYFSGKTFVGAWKGHPLMLKAHSNGFLNGVSKNRFDQGRWFVQGSKLCFSLKVWTKNRPKCGAMYRRGGEFYGFVRSNGRPRLTLRRK